MFYAEYYTNETPILSLKTCKKIQDSVKFTKGWI